MVELIMVCSHYLLLYAQLSHTDFPCSFLYRPFLFPLTAFLCMEGLPLPLTGVQMPPTRVYIMLPMRVHYLLPTRVCILLPMQVI